MLLISIKQLKSRRFSNIVFALNYPVEQEVMDGETYFTKG